MATWRYLIGNELFYKNESWDDVIAVAPSEDVLDIEFDDGYGGSEGQDFLVWTKEHVYFPVVYDGAESVGSAPRNPQTQGQPHVGGE